MILLLFWSIGAFPLPCAVQAAEVVAVPSLDGQRITAAIAVAEGAWVGTGSGVSLVSPSGQLLRSYGPSDGFPGGTVLSLALFRGKVYAGTASGIAVLDGSRWELLQKADRFSLANSFLRTAPGGDWLWVAAVHANGALLRFDGERWEFLGGEGRGTLNSVKAIAFQDDAAWLGTLGSGVYRRTGTGVQYFKTRDGLPSSTVYCIEMFDGAAWAGTHAGAARFQDGRWVRMTPGEGVPLSSVQALAASPDALFLGGPEGVFRYRSGKFEQVPAGDGQGFADGVTALAYDRGVLYAGTRSGFLILKGM